MPRPWRVDPPVGADHKLEGSYEEGCDGVATEGSRHGGEPGARGEGPGLPDGHHGVGQHRGAHSVISVRPAQPFAQSINLVVVVVNLKVNG